MSLIKQLKKKNLSLKSKHPFLANFFDNLDKSIKLKTQKGKTNKKKPNVYNTVSKLYNDLLGIYFDKN